MIALIEGQVYEMFPLTTVGGDFRVEVDTDMQAKAYIGENRIDYGVIWHSFGKSVDIHAKTGKITVNQPGHTKIRGIFGNFHHDFDIQIS